MGKLNLQEGEWRFCSSRHTPRPPATQRHLVAVYRGKASGELLVRVVMRDHQLAGHDYWEPESFWKYSDPIPDDAGVRFALSTCDTVEQAEAMWERLK